MPRRKRRKLAVVSAPKLADLLARHEQCEVRYRNGKYVIVRRWDGKAASDTLHEGSVLNNHIQRKVMKKLGFTAEEIDELLD